MYSALLVLVSTAALVAGYPNGPPVIDHPDICGTMFPKHTHKDPARKPVAAKNTSAPFRFTFSPACYKSGISVDVKLSVSREDTYYEGLFVQARESNTAVNASYGQFTTTDDTLDTYDCFKTGRKNALGQNSKAHYKVKSFTWEPTANLRKDIKFVATVVHETTEFWVGVTSEAIKYDAECDASSHTMANVLLMIGVLLWSIL